MPKAQACLGVGGEAGVHATKVGRVKAVGGGHVRRVLRLVVHAGVARHCARQAGHPLTVRHLRRPHNCHARGLRPMLDTKLAASLAYAETAPCAGTAQACSDAPP